MELQIDMQEYFYEVDVRPTSGKTGLLTSHGLAGIEVASPLESPKEKTRQWTPEHLLGAAVSSGFMNTFLETAENLKLEIINYTSQCFIKLEKISGKYVVREVLIRPTIQLSEGEEVAKGYLCVERAKKACPFMNAMNIGIELNPQFEYFNSEEKTKTA